MVLGRACVETLLIALRQALLENELAANFLVSFEVPPLKQGPGSQVLGPAAAAAEANAAAVAAIAAAAASAPAASAATALVAGGAAAAAAAPSTVDDAESAHNLAMFRDARSDHWEMMSSASTRVSGPRFAESFKLNAVVQRRPTTITQELLQQWQVTRSLFEVLPVAWHLMLRDPGQYPRVISQDKSNSRICADFFAIGLDDTTGMYDGGSQLYERAPVADEQQEVARLARAF